MSESTDLRLTGRSADGTELELVDQDGNKFNLRISDSLRANVNQPRLAAVTVIFKKRFQQLLKRFKPDYVAVNLLTLFLVQQIGRLKR
jgi:hypothetical protein